MLEEGPDAGAGTSDAGLGSDAGGGPDAGLGCIIWIPVKVALGHPTL